MVVGNIYYNTSHIHSLDYNEGFIHIGLKYQDQQKITHKADEQTYNKIVKEFKGDTMNKVIKVYDTEDKREYYINLNTIVKMNTGISKNGIKRLYMTESMGNQISYALDDDQINKVIKYFNN